MFEHILSEEALMAIKTVEHDLPEGVGAAKELKRIEFCTCTGCISSTLVSIREQPHIGNHPVIPLVDGIGSFCWSIMSTESIELTSFIDPDLTWKTVAKGSRSTTRRNRKLVAKSAMIEVEAADKSTTETEAQGVSESEKLGVAVLGRRFAEKVEHVPIKKRRFMFHSPSPPPAKKSSSPCHKVPKQFVLINHASDMSKLSVGVIDGKTVEVSSEKLSCNGHDFSGIEILADVACNSHMGDDILPTVQNRVVEESEKQQPSLAFSLPVEDIHSSAITVVVSKNDTVHEGEAETLVSQDHAVAASDESCADECDRGAARAKIENIASQNNSVVILGNLSADEHNEMAAEAETGKIASQDSCISVSDRSSADEHNRSAAEAETGKIASQTNGIADKSSADEYSGMATEAEAGKIESQSHCIAVLDKSSTDEPDMKAGDDETRGIDFQNSNVTKLDKCSADERNGKVENTAWSRDDRLHWDLNLSMDAWEQPCSSGDDASQRNVVGEVSEDIDNQKQCVDDNNDHVNGVITSDGLVAISMLPEFNSDTNGKHAKEFQSGYDSQIEDGELRESYPCWEGNDGDDAGEIEHVDYDTEPEDEIVYSLSEANGHKMDNADRGAVSEWANGTRKSESCASEDSSRNRLAETNDGSDIEKHVVVCLNDSQLKSSSKGFVSKAFKREFSSRDATQRRRFDFCEESYDRDVGSDKFMGRDRSCLHSRGRSPVRGHFSYWDSSKHHHSPIYNNGSYNFGRSRPKSVIEGRGCMNSSDPTVSGSGNEGQIRRQFSSGSYQSRFRRYPEGLNRNFRGMDRSVPNDSSEYPGGRFQHRMSNRRERSNSPIFRRLHYPQNYRKSHSRSRSRSPVAWNNRNRPLNFRTHNRMDRVRLPFQKGFAADHEMGFSSPPRNRCSPQHHFRWFEDRNSNPVGDNNNNNKQSDNNNNFRERKLPMRTFRPSQRFDSGRKVNSENHFRLMHHRRFPDNVGNGRGYKNEGNDGDKNRNRYEMIHRVRRYDNNSTNNSTNGDDIRRFRFNRKESLVANES